MKPQALFFNRFIWSFVLSGVLAGAWFSGERILYLTAAVLFALPAVSYAITFALLRGLRVSRAQPDAIVKNAAGVLAVGLHNITFLPLGNVEVLVNADEHAFAETNVKVSCNDVRFLYPFGRRTLEIPFQIAYRGHYEFGLAAVRVSDITGLFRLKREFDANKMITCLPSVADVSHFPLSMNLMTQASSRYDIRDEDYSTISDIRQYQPTDSIKRVHWKLTAKRNEWLVKNFQSNALNLVSIVLESTRLPLGSLREVYALEDGIIENALGVAKFCLSRGMPVDFLPSHSEKVSAKNPAEFEIIYRAASELRFATNTENMLTCHGILSRELNEATGYVNAVVITPRLNAELYERIRNGTNNGHFIAVLYFKTSRHDELSEEIFKLLAEGGTPCYGMEAS